MKNNKEFKKSLKDMGTIINTEIGKLLVLDSKEDYLILFDSIQNKIIKAIDYSEDYINIYWDKQEIFDSLDELFSNLSINQKKPAESDNRK